MQKTNCECYKCKKAIYRPRYAMLGEAPCYCSPKCRDATNRTTINGGWENQKWVDYPVAEPLTIG